MGLPLKAIPKDERPRERLLRLGPEVLTDTELLAILLGTGTRGRSVLDVSQEILQHCKSGVRGLAHLRHAEFKRVAPGLGEARVCQILAAVQLGLRAAAPQPGATALSNPQAVYQYLLPMFAQRMEEQFLVVFLNAKNIVIDVESVSHGTLTASLVHPREIFRGAIRRSAHAILLAHNHPSGDPTPSREDREVTLRMVQAGKVIGIEVLDHVVVGSGQYVSFRERGLMERT